MAQKVVTIYTDDLTGAEASDVSTHRFSLNGVEYEIDLTPENYDKLDAALRPFIEKGRKVGRLRRSVAGAKRATPSEDTAAIRQWAKEEGLEISERGRVPASIRDAYEKAH
ncbi:histone-like nucleoid-structuring protein Lsr2 [Streptomyces sp. 4N509B]|uniref:histone-like nucleoid-structuring protein Lsr2 n=1 Tax=Streptomyces sp. 4N509B TaxID=3457413 RepID=UPI003FCF0DD7